MRLTAVAERVAAGDISARSDQKTADEIGILAGAINEMTSQLQGTINTLEQRVTDRTRAIETSALVGRRLSTILDPTQLAKETVEQLQQAFNYNFVQIYFFDELHEHLILAGATGAAGTALLEQAQMLAQGQGPVGRSTQTGVPVLILDTTQDPSWQANPLLSETRSEVVVPIVAGDEILGALDVQQNQVYGLGQQDADQLQLIASQVAVTLRNARLYGQVQNDAQREALLSSIVQHIQETTTVESALQVAIRELGRAVKARRAHVQLLTATQNQSGVTDEKPLAQ
jgi:GAF domain-containing protein